MRLNPKTVGLTIAIFGAAVYLQGCTGVQNQDAFTEREQPAEVNTVVEVPSTTEHSTIRLIEVLDNAGCDFSGVSITETTVRKGSSTLSVGCK